MNCEKKMETANKSRWGVVALAIVMLVVTMVNTSINGQKNSLYYAVWILVAWYGYKGNLEQIKSWMKYLIWLNVGVLLLVLMFFEEQTVGYAIRGGDKQSLIFGVLAMLVPKILLYLWCDKEIGAQKLIDDDKASDESNEIELGREKKSVIVKKNTVKVDAVIKTQASNWNNQTINQNTNSVNTLSTNNDDNLWEQVAEEFDGPDRKKGLYARLFAENNGDEIKIKAMYYRVRVEELKNTSKQNQINSHKKEGKEGYEDVSDEDCINLNWHEKFSMNGYDCFELYNGKAMVITPKRKIIYRNLQSLKIAMEIHEKKGVFIKDNVVKEIML